MSRRFLINLAAAAAVLLLLWWLSRSMNYRPANVPHRAAAAPTNVATTPEPPASPAEGVPGAAPPDSDASSSASGAPPSLQEAAGYVRHAEIGFESRERLQEHFEKHGAEFGATTPDGYLLLAQALRDRPAGGDVLEARRADNVTTRFDRASGAFIAFDQDRTIRTFFRPNDGESYFWRQLGRAH